MDKIYLYEGKKDGIDFGHGCFYCGEYDIRGKPQEVVGYSIESLGKRTIGIPLCQFHHNAKSKLGCKVLVKKEEIWQK